MKSKSSSTSEGTSASLPSNRSPLLQFRRYLSSPVLLSPAEYSNSDPCTRKSQSSSTSRETGGSLPNNRSAYPYIASRRYSSIPSLWSPVEFQNPFTTRESRSNSVFVEASTNLPLRYSSSPSTVWTPDQEYRFTPPFPISSGSDTSNLPVNKWDYEKYEFAIKPTAEEYPTSPPSGWDAFNLPVNKWDYEKYEFAITSSTAEEYPTSAPFPTTEYQASSTSTETSSNPTSKKWMDKQYEMAVKDPQQYLALLLSRNEAYVPSSTRKKRSTKLDSKTPLEYSTSNPTTTTESQSSYASRETNTALSIDKSMSIDFEIDSGPSSQVEPSPSDIRDAALPRRSFCTRLRKQKGPWLEHIKLYSFGFSIAASLQVLSFIFVMLRYFSPIGDPISFTITAGCLFAISFTFFRAIVPEGPSLLASPTADDTDEETVRG